VNPMTCWNIVLRSCVIMTKNYDFLSSGWTEFAVKEIHAKFGTRGSLRLKTMSLLQV
jgi:hypothetical protein